MTDLSEIIEDEIQKALKALGDTVSPALAGHVLRQLAQHAYTTGRDEALMNLMSVDDVANELGVSSRRARAIIQHRHERFGVGMQVGKNTWIVSRHELAMLQPDEKYRKKDE